MQLNIEITGTIYKCIMYKYSLLSHLKQADRQQKHLRSRTAENSSNIIEVEMQKRLAQIKKIYV